MIDKIFQIVIAIDDACILYYAQLKAIINKYVAIFSVYWEKLFMSWYRVLWKSLPFFGYIYYGNLIAWRRWEQACEFAIFCTMGVILFGIWLYLKHINIAIKTGRLVGDWYDGPELGWDKWSKGIDVDNITLYLQELEHLVKTRKELRKMIDYLPDLGIASTLYPITDMEYFTEGYPKSQRYDLILLYNKFTKNQEYILDKVVIYRYTAKHFWQFELPMSEEVLELVNKRAEHWAEFIHKYDTEYDLKEKKVIITRLDQKDENSVTGVDETGRGSQNSNNDKKNMIFLIFSGEFLNNIDFYLLFGSLLIIFLILFFLRFWKDGRFYISTILNNLLLPNMKSILTSHVSKNKFVCISIIPLNLNFIHDIWYFSGEKLVHYVAFIEHFEFLDIVLAFNIFLFVLFSTNILFAKNAMYSLLSLIYIFVNSGFLLIFFNLEFFGLLYVIIYVGAIAVLFLFIIMMLKFEKNTQNNLISFKRRFLNWIFNLGLFFLILFYFFYFYKNNFLDKITFFNTGIFPEFFNVSYLNLIKEKEFVISRFFNIQTFVDDLNHLSFALYLDYVYVFLLAGLILLISMIAPIVLTYRQRFDIKLQKPSLQILRNKKNILFLKDLK